MLQIANTGPRLKLAAGVTLEPGQNEVAETAWAECLHNKMTRIFLESRIILVVPGAAGSSVEDCTGVHVQPAEPGTPDAEPTLAKDLIAAIKVEGDMEYLRGLFEGERRTTVVIAINARLESLKRAAYADDSED